MSIMLKDFGNITLDLIAFEKYDPYTMILDDGTWSGILIDVLTIISKTLNFRYTMHIQDDRIWGGDTGNGSHNGAVGAVQRGDVDIGLGTFTETVNRMEVVDFAYPVVFGDYRMFLKRPASADFFYFIYPFRAYTWLVIGSIIVVVTTMSILASCFHGYPVKSAVWSDSHMWPSAWTIWRSVVAQPAYSSRPRTTTHHILMWVWWLMTVILVAFYTSTLTSTLAVRKVTLPVNSVKELAESSLPVVVGEHIAAQDVLEAATEGPMKTIYDRVVNSNNFLPNVSLLVDVVLANPGTVGIINSETLLGISRQNSDFRCNVSLGASLFGTREGMIFQKNSPYLEAISIVLMRLIETGIYETIKGKYQPTGRCSEQEWRDYQRPLDMDVMCGVFYLLSTGVLIASITLIGEIMTSCKCKQRQIEPKKDEDLNDADKPTEAPKCYSVSQDEQEGYRYSDT